MKRLSIAALALVLAASAAQAQTTVGVANSSNCFPFGCALNNDTTASQQLYLGSKFVTPLSIGSVSFTKAASSAANATLDTMTFGLAFYTSSRTLSTLSTDLASNRGTLLADFGTFTISGATPDVLTLSAPTAFVYNPAAGNLLMQITVLSDTISGSGSFFLSEDYIPSNANATIRRAVNTASGFNFTSTNALVTTFSSTTAAAVPEPASWAMMLAGFGLIGSAMRRRKIVIRFA